jgi:S1-C subfamily serine protease
MKLFAWFALLPSLAGVLCAAAIAAESEPLPPTTALPPPSSSAQQLYAAAKNDLLQVRVLLKSGRTQASVGSGFLIGNSDLVVTNYHVVSQVALEPSIYVAEFLDTSRQSGTVELLAVDVLHDLAVVRVKRHGTGFFTVPEHLPDLSQGQYLYSLGNPLDLGFAISEGTYNGIIGRSFYDQLLFTGSINAGMSGGPNVTRDGHVAGVNVSKRLDGELVSFLVPVRYVQELLKRVASQSKPPADFRQVVGQQLLTHQGVIVARLLAQPLTMKSLGQYQVPVWESDQVRCWGHSNAKPERPYSVDTVNCSMESALYISSQMNTGFISIRHQLIQGKQLGAVRFSGLASNSFKNEDFGGAKGQGLTGPQCSEMFVKNKNLPMRAVLCVRAYRKFAGLYDFALLTGSTDDNANSLQSRFDTRGVSYENGMRVSRLLLESISHGSKS